MNDRIAITQYDEGNHVLNERHKYVKENGTLIRAYALCFLSRDFLRELF